MASSVASGIREEVRTPVVKPEPKICVLEHALQGRVVLDPNSGHDAGHGVSMVAQCSEQGFFFPLPCFCFQSEINVIHPTCFWAV